MNGVIKRFQRHSTVFKNKGNVESRLNESLNQFKFDSTSLQHFLRFQQCRTTCSNAPDILTGSTTVNACERMLKQMLKPFKRAFTSNYGSLPQKQVHEELKKAIHDTLEKKSGLSLLLSTARVIQRHLK